MTVDEFMKSGLASGSEEERPNKMEESSDDEDQAG